MEAGGLQEKQDAFITETGLEFSFLFALYEGSSGDPAIAQDAMAYHERIGGPNFPIFADGTGKLASSTPLTQEYAPETCALTPELEFISCHRGHAGYELSLEAIKTHAGF